MEVIIFPILGLVLLFILLIPVAWVLQFACRLAGVDKPRIRRAVWMVVVSTFAGVVVSIPLSVLGPLSWVGLLAVRGYIYSRMLPTELGKGFLIGAAEFTTLIFLMVSVYYGVDMWLWDLRYMR